MEKSKPNSESEFVWSTLYAFIFDEEIESIVDFVSKMFEFGIEYSPAIESILMTCWQCPDTKNFMELAKESLNKNIFDINKHYFLVAKLFLMDEINIDEAVYFLNVYSKGEVESIYKEVEDVVDSLWLVNEDLKDGFKSPNDDDFLGNALLALSDSFPIS